MDISIHDAEQIERRGRRLVSGAILGAIALISATWMGLFVFLGANSAHGTLQDLRDVWIPDVESMTLELPNLSRLSGVYTADGVLLIVQQLEATGMIEVDIQAQEWGTYIGAVVSGEEYPVSVLGWFFDFPDPENYLQPFIENGGIGTMVTSKEGEITPGVNPALLELLAASRVETDPTARAATLDELQNVYADEVVTVPLWIEPEFIVYRDGICGDASLPNPESLNIGATMEFVYSVLGTDGS